MEEYNEWELSQQDWHNAKQEEKKERQQVALLLMGVVIYDLTPDPQDFLFHKNGQFIR